MTQRTLQRLDVASASTLSRCCINVMCPLGSTIFNGKKFSLHNGSTIYLNDIEPTDNFSFIEFKLYFPGHPV